MKRNVDLTENRFFTTPEEPTGIGKILWDWLEKQERKPWEFNLSQIHSDFDLNTFHRPLIATGDKNERERWQRSQQEQTEEICSHCGKDKGKLPWARKECGCSHMMTLQRKIPWDFD